MELDETNREIVEGNRGETEKIGTHKRVTGRTKRN
jgi:hypothetical protein